MNQREGSYGRIVGLVRRQVQKTNGTFTNQSVFAQLKRAPGVVRGSVASALRTLRKTGEVVIVRNDGKELVFKRQE